MDFNFLISQIQLTDDFFKERIGRTIDRHLTIRNWLLGFYIVEFEQKGEDRAAYGKSLLQKLSEKLDTPGLSFRSLKLFRQFYHAYPIIGQTVSAFLQDDSIGQTLSAQFNLQAPNPTHQPSSDESKAIWISNYQVEPDKLLSNLSFSHFVELIKIDAPLKRAYYEIECIKGVWSVRELKRQIASLTYERSAAADNPQAMTANFATDAEKLSPDQLIKTPYVFDFLGLPDGILGSESDLENALIGELKHFIMELGHGFCFEGQQQKIIIGGEYFFIDLVFYHRILKCHVLIELKIDEFSHAHAGQLNTYLQYVKNQVQQADDKPPIGILLCTNQNEELVQYALGGMDENLFVSHYQTALPTTEQLEQFLKAEKKKL